jgi:hypothetical protein
MARSTCDKGALAPQVDRKSSRAARGRTRTRR